MSLNTDTYVPDYVSEFDNYWIKILTNYTSSENEKVRKSVANDRSILKSMEEKKEIEEGFIREEMRMSEK